MTSDVFLGLENGAMEGCIRKINILKMIPLAKIARKPKTQN